MAVREESTTPSDDAAAAGEPGVDFSLASFGEIVFPCLEAVSPGLVVEVGAYQGAFTRPLLEWAARNDARVAAIEPEPPAQLMRVAADHPELELVRAPSHDALRELPPADAVIIDGDHNHYTVSEELRIVSERSGEDRLPLVLFHDVCWPHARRDTYYAPDRIPDEHRQPIAHDAAVAPDVPGVAAAGLRYPYAAEREGGPRNGVLTAIEDFLEGRDDLRLAIVPACFGLGILWRLDAPWTDAVARIVDPWDRSPLVARLEASRVQGIVERAREGERRRLLEALLHSRAFTLAERLSRIRQRGKPVVSRDELRRAVEDS